MMDAEEVLKWTEELIAIPSLSGNENQVCDFLFQKLTKLGWDVYKIPVEGSRYNLFVSFGVPKIIYTTHLDVVAGPDFVFKPRREGDRLYGRGACDAKGIAATMVAAVSHLLEKQADGLALLFVIGEEVGTGLGAKAASAYLKKYGVEYLVNGEPTECKLIQAHKGFLGVKICCRGKACHSGYPSLGDDANAKLIEVAHRLLHASFGLDPVLGPATINVGLIRGGVGANVVSPFAELSCAVRTVESQGQALAAIKEVVGDLAAVEIVSELDPAHMTLLEGFQTGTVNFGTDIPNFSGLEAMCLLYGPGSILVAHSDEEYIEKQNIEQAIRDYQTIYFRLQEKKTKP
jgi:acetylornithine deacetylase